MPSKRAGHPLYCYVDSNKARSCTVIKSVQAMRGSIVQSTEHTLHILPPEIAAYAVVINPSSIVEVSNNSNCVNE